MGEMNIGPYLMLYVRSSLKYIIDLNIKTKTIKLLEENIGSFSHLCSLEAGTYFFDRHKQHELFFNNKLNFFIKSFCSLKDPIKNKKTSHRMIENISMLTKDVQRTLKTQIIRQLN